MASNAVHTILSKLSQQKPYIQEHFDVEKIGIFGSHAKGHETNESDLCVYAIILQPVLPFKKVET